MNKDHKNGILSLVKPSIELAEAVGNIATGNYIEGIKKAAVIGSDLCLRIASDKVKSNNQTPDYAKYGLDFLNTVAFNAATAKSAMREVWLRLLEKAIDPSNKGIEIRHEDIQLIQGINPSDAILILGVDCFSDVSLAAWQTTELYRGLMATDRSFIGVEYFYKNLNRHIPLRLITEFVSSELGSSISLSEDDLIYSLESKSKGDFPIFSSVGIRSEIKEMLEKSFRRDPDYRFRKDYFDILKKVDELNPPSLVSYSLTEFSDRIRKIIK